MRRFINKNKHKKLIFLEIPLLIESKLYKYFDVILFIKANKNIRLERFKSKGGSSKIFNILNAKQLSYKKKIKFCDHVIVNENLKFLKNKLLDILKSMNEILDTETTGLSFKDGHKIVEIACIETKDLIATGKAP